MELVGAGAVVTKDVPPNAIVVGNPARIHGYVDGQNARVGDPQVIGELPTCRVAGLGCYT